MPRPAPTAGDGPSGEARKRSASPQSVVPVAPDVELAGEESSPEPRPHLAPSAPTDEDRTRDTETQIAYAAELAGLTREQKRSRRARAVRAKTEHMGRTSKVRLKVLQTLYPEDTSVLRPRTRGECENGVRPCPFVSCRYHLYLDVDRKNGSIKIVYPDLEIEDLRESCALDVADRGGATLEETGAIANVTRERIRQIENKALDRVKKRAKREGLDEYVRVA